jgi:hypothetical protein
MRQTGEFGLYLARDIFDKILRDQSCFFSNDAEKASCGTGGLRNVNKLVGVVVKRIKEPSDEGGLTAAHITGEQSYPLSFDEVRAAVFEVIQLPGEKYILDIFFEGKIIEPEKWFNHDYSFLSV